MMLYFLRLGFGSLGVWWGWVRNILYRSSISREHCCLLSVCYSPRLIEIALPLEIGCLVYALRNTRVRGSCLY
jgi:hypothetical protein